jgi:hypothetical protein
MWWRSQRNPNINAEACMYHAYIETDANDVLRMMLRDGFTGGKALLSFILGLECFCRLAESPENQAIRQWFYDLEQAADSGPVSRSICQLANPLLQAWYSGNWEYRENEYQAFRLCEKLPLTEEEFKRTVQLMRTKWVDASVLLQGVQSLLEIINRNDPPETWWYGGEHTKIDLEALVNTVTLAVQRRAMQVRIRIT